MHCLSHVISSEPHPSALTQTWIKKDVYPLIAAVSCVISYGIYKSVEHVMVSEEPELEVTTEPTTHTSLTLQTDPDANFNPSRRSTMLRHTEEEVSRSR